MIAFEIIEIIPVIKSNVLFFSSKLESTIVIKFFNISLNSSFSNSILFWGIRVGKVVSDIFTFQVFVKLSFVFTPIIRDNRFDREWEEVYDLFKKSLCTS